MAKKKPTAHKSHTPPKTEDDYLRVPDKEATSGAVAIQDFDPANPGVEITEPQKVFMTNNRRARKESQRANLDKSSLTGTGGEESGTSVEDE